jgi:hypothetical protein
MSDCTVTLLVRSRAGGTFCIHGQSFVLEPGVLTEVEFPLTALARGRDIMLAPGAALARSTASPGDDGSSPPS